MATILIDTSVIFDHVNGRFGRTQFLDQLVEQGHVLACCPVNIAEVYAGLRPGEETKTDVFLNSSECFAGDRSNSSASRSVAPGLAEEATPSPTPT